MENFVCRCGKDSEVKDFYLVAAGEHLLKIECTSCLREYEILRSEVKWVEHKGNMVRLHLRDPKPSESLPKGSKGLKTVREATGDKSDVPDLSEKTNLVIAEAKRRALSGKA